MARQTFMTGLNENSGGDDIKTKDFDQVDNKKPVKVNPIKLEQLKRQEVIKEYRDMLKDIMNT